MIEKIEKAGNFSNKLNENALIICPQCGQRWGIMKWGRLLRNNSMTCPGCGTVHPKGTDFRVTYLDREFAPEKTPPIPAAKPGDFPPKPQQPAIAHVSVKAEDKLTRKDGTVE
jgi:hypothetical protein